MAVLLHTDLARLVHGNLGHGGAQGKGCAWNSGGGLAECYLGRCMNLCHSTLSASCISEEKTLSRIKCRDGDTNKDPQIYHSCTGTLTTRLTEAVLPWFLAYIARSIDDPAERSTVGR